VITNQHSFLPRVFLIQNCIRVLGDTTLVACAPETSNAFKNTQHQMAKGTSQKFTFSKIFTDKIGQKCFFEEAVLGTVKEFISGQNCLVFTYGVTNSGKTYTIQGWLVLCGGVVMKRDYFVLSGSLFKKYFRKLKAFKIQKENIVFYHYQECI